MRTPAHAGIAGNEKVDKLVKQGLNPEHIDISCHSINHTYQYSRYITFFLKYLSPETSCSDAFAGKVHVKRFHIVKTTGSVIRGIEIIKPLDLKQVLVD